MMDGLSIGDLVTRIGGDTTHKLQTRTGDQLLWFRWVFEAILSRAPPNLLDVWSPTSGDRVLITNRIDDFPAWFELHPLEVAGTLVPWMEERLREGYQPPEPTDGPNIWRVASGDRIVWTGPPREETQGTNGVLRVYDFRTSALVFGMCGTNPFRWISINDSPESLKRGRAALAAVQRLGTPRQLNVATEWRLGGNPPTNTPKLPPTSGHGVPPKTAKPHLGFSEQMEQEHDRQMKGWKFPKAPAKPRSRPPRAK